MKRYFPIALAATMMAFVSAGAFAASNSNDVSDDTYQEKLNSDPVAQTYLDIDSNSDNRVSEDEFRAYYDESGIYDNWDVNDDGVIDDDEFVEVLYLYYDDNDDGFIDDAEWQDGVMVDDYGENGFWDN